MNTYWADGLIISTPNYTHLDVLKVAVKSGKHIFLEKPMATTVQDAYEIQKIAADSPAVLQIGLQYRYKAMYVEAIHEAQERKSLGHEIGEDEETLMARALAENAVIVAQFTPYFPDKPKKSKG